jgi:hypothetical protein
VPTLALQVDAVFDVRTPENMMAPSGACLETKGDQQAAKILERDGGISVAPEDTLQQSLVLRHAMILASNRHTVPRCSAIRAGCGSSATTWTDSSNADVRAKTVA